jgi:tetratricopeptide (TPR) repeat protein
MLALADLLEGTERGGEALTTVRQAVQLEPKNVEANLFLAECLGRLGKYAESAETYRVLITLEPTNATHHAYLGIVLKLSGRRDEALAAYGKAIALDPKLSMAYYNRGVLEGEAGQTDKAVADFLKAAEVNPTDADATYNAGQALYNLGRFAEARELWLRTNKLEPGNTKTVRKIIQAFYAEKKYAEAKPYLAEVIRLHQESKDPAERKTRYFCIDQFKVGGLSVMANEAYEKSGDLYYHYAFYVYDAKQQFVQSINLESSAGIRAMGTPYVMGADLAGGTHATYGRFFKELPEYATVKDLVIEMLNKAPQPVTSSTKDEKGNVKINMPGSTTDKQ